ncbi:MAG: Hsp20/alpha crystallin family protein [Desulfosarcina sp.]|nr:Hsp20/alpha crystallin family protein [Desulfobacterales bacterium]
MELVRWNPWRNRLNDRDHVNGVFDELFYPVNGQDGLPAAWNWNPVVDVYENDGHFVIKAELPGIDKKDIDLDVKGRVLTLKGERHTEADMKNDNACCRERVYGRFARAFTLPNEIEADKISADYKDGVLKIEIPKPEVVKPKQISIH